MLTDILIGIAIVFVIANIVVTILANKKNTGKGENLESLVQTTNMVVSNLSVELSRQRDDYSRELNQIAQNIIQNQVSQNAFQKERLDNLERQIVSSLKGVEQNIKENSEQTTVQLRVMRDGVENNLRIISENTTTQLEKVRSVVEQSTRLLNEQTTVQLTQMRNLIDENVRRMADENKEQLGQMRNVVDEKLSQTLETRLNQSFEIINKSLSQVNQGLGDMQSLAKDVGGLKNVLQNVKVRGTWAEWQLDNLLSEFLNKEQYIKNCPINPKTQERVDFAIILPGKDEQVLLPIDSKFPIEEYNRLITASQNSDLESYEKALKNLELRIKEEAKSISLKYILVPKTTDFAIMYLPVEGLYAEVVKKEGLCEMLQRQYRITVCGPSTLGAMLNALQMGFKTLAIEKKSSEIHKMLLVFKTHFVKFTELLEKTQKKINEASDTIEDATKKTRIITKKLSSVELESFEEEQIILEAGIDDES